MSCGTFEFHAASGDSGDNSCEFAYDGECDAPQFCDFDTENVVGSKIRDYGWIDLVFSQLSTYSNIKFDRNTALIITEMRFRKT